VRDEVIDLLFSVGPLSRTGGIRGLACDARCDKAWGVNGRRVRAGNTIQMSDDEEDVVYLADHETGTSPFQGMTCVEDGTKPTTRSDHNRWCLRECERSRVVEVGEQIAAPDFGTRLYNQTTRNGVENPSLETGRIMTADHPCGNFTIGRRA
jgi:hypothetical protein